MKTLSSQGTLKREMGVLGATFMGVGAMVGTGVFVSLGVAAGVAGPAVLPALLLAGGVAACNALSSAQLAANHPVSGGTYEYGYRYLRPWLGFTAGWMFLCAKSASAATAALGFAGYLLTALASVGFPAGGGPAVSGLEVLIAGGSVALFTALVLGGMRRSNAVNIAVVSVTLTTLLIFVLAGLPTLLDGGGARLLEVAGTEAETAPTAAFLQGTALLFVAFTGFGRIATMGEEVKAPRRTIPRAILLALGGTTGLYLAVALVAVGAVGAATLGSPPPPASGAVAGLTGTGGGYAPLEVAAARFTWSGARWVVLLGAMTAMLGVLLNLILGLSRVLLAMGRRLDMPSVVARIDGSGTTPWVSVLVVGGVIFGLTLVGDVKTTWSFSAFTVLVYYAITNLAALALPREDRLYPAWVSWTGLASCLFLAFWVERWIWLVGLGVVALGLAWFQLARVLAGSTRGAA